MRKKDKALTTEKETSEVKIKVRIEEEPETFQSRVPDSKRMSLLRYMTIMFAVAFVLVLMSMVLQTRSSHSTITAMHESAISKAEALQDENRELAEELATVKTQLETAWKDNDAMRAEQENLRTVYDALARVLMGEEKEGDVGYAQALEIVENLKQYLSPSVAGMYETWLEENSR